MKPLSSSSTCMIGRQLLCSAAILCSAVISTSAWAAADLVVINGDIYSVDPQKPRIEAFAVEDGKFTAIGTNEEILALADGNTRKIDVGGKTVTPGFIDSHQHFNGESNKLNLYVKTRQEWADLLKAEHERLPKDAWLIGGSWDQTIIDDVMPTKEFLDQIVGDRPTILTHIDGHYVWVNSAVIKLAGIKADTPVPPGGEIVVDPKTGEPTGILKEGAAQLVRNLPPKPTQDELYKSLPGALHWANSIGITGMHNMMQSFDDYLRVLKDGDLTVRVWHGYFGALAGDTPDAQVASLLKIRNDVRRQVDATGEEGKKGPLFTIGFRKLINDGVLSAHTAVLLEDYADQHGWRGEWMAQPEDLKEMAKKLAAADFQIAIHSIGDGAVHASLDALEAAAAYKPTLPNRIEHVELLSQDDLPRFAKLNVAASMTPNHMTKAVAYIEERIDPARESRAYTWQSLLNTGANVIFGSDSTTSIHQEPLKQIADAILRTNHAGFNDGKPWHGEQAVTFSEALYAYTLGPAKTTAWGDQIGSITPGKWADFVVIDGTVKQPAAGEVGDLAIAATYLAGEVVYQKDK